MGFGLLSFGSPGYWDPQTYFGSSLKTWWDAADSSTVATSGSNVTSWADKTGNGRTATSVSTGATYSATARNSKPGLVFTGSTAERLSYSATGLPSGANPGTIVVVGYCGVVTATAGTAISYGIGSTAYDQRQVRVSATTGLCQLSFTTDTAYSWNGVDRIFFEEFTSSPSQLRYCVDGSYDDPNVEWVQDYVTGTTTGRIGSTVSNAAPWNGVIQCIMMFNRVLTQLEKDLLTGYLADRYALTGNLASGHPYKNSRPRLNSTLSQDLLSGYSTVWSDNFTSLSFRTGGNFTGQSSGYVTGKGTWAPAGLSYMTDSKGYGDFGYGVFIRHTYNFQAIDPTFPPLGMLDITSDGVILKGSDQYPLVRAGLFKYRGSKDMYLSSLISTTYSAKIKPPYARRVRWTLNSADRNDFPAVWGLGNLYAGNFTATGSMAGNVLTITSISESPVNDTQIGLDYSAIAIPSPAIANATPSYNGISSFGTATGRTGTYNMAFSLPTDFTASISGTTLTVTNMPAGGYLGSQELKIGQTIINGSSGSGVTTCQIISGSGTVWGIDTSQTVSSQLMSAIIPSTTFTIGRRHYEVDDFERFGHVYPDDQLNATMHIYSRAYQIANISSDGTTSGTAAGTGRFNTGTNLWPSIAHETIVIHRFDYIYVFIDGVEMLKVAVPADSDPNQNDLHHTILNFAMGMSFENYPGSFNGTIAGTTLTTSNAGNANIAIGKTVSGTGVTANTTITGGSGSSWTVDTSQTVGPVTMYISPVWDTQPSMTVRSVEILAPSSNTSGIFPSAPPVPTITWGGSFTGGSVASATASGTTIATLGGASTYRVIPYLSTFTGLSVTGSSLKTSGTLSAGTYDFYIEGTDAGGVPGIAPKLTLTVT